VRPNTNYAGSFFASHGLAERSGAVHSAFPRARNLSFWSSSIPTGVSWPGRPWRLYEVKTVPAVRRHFPSRFLAPILTVILLNLISPRSRSLLVNMLAWSPSMAALVFCCRLPPWSWSPAFRGKSSAVPNGAPLTSLSGGNEEFPAPVSDLRLSLRRVGFMPSAKALTFF